MPEAKEPSILKLPIEMKTRLHTMEKEINGARRAIESLKKMGMETRVLEDRLDWATEVRKTLLAEFD